jgi:hypothetical protein
MGFNAGKHLRPRMGILIGARQERFSQAREEVAKAAVCLACTSVGRIRCFLAFFAFNRMSKLRGISDGDGLNSVLI